MILDYMKNYRMYNSLVSNLEEGMTFVNTLLDKPEGRYEAEHGIYAMVQIGITSDIGKDRMETHEKYLDVQMVFEGGRHLSGRKRLSWKRRRNTIRRRISSFTGEAERKFLPQRACSIFCFPRTPTGAGEWPGKKGKSTARLC